jgi:hypothetical protein
MAFSTRQLGRLAAPDLDGSLSTWQRQQLSLEVLESLVPIPQLRDPTVEFLGTEGLGSSPGIEIIIRRPVASGASMRPRSR